MEICIGMKIRSGGHRWVQLYDDFDCTLSLTSKMSTDVYNCYYRPQGRFSMLKQMKSVSFQKRVMDVCKILFLSFNFMDKLDRNLGLVGFENGIWDLSTKSLRDGCPDDFVSLSVGYNFRLPSMVKQVELDQYLQKVFPDFDVRMQVVSQVASWLGKTNDAYFLISNGSNGKTIFMNLVMLCFGQYYVNLSPSLWKHQGRLSKVEMTRYQTCRVGVTSEVEEIDSDWLLNMVNHKQFTFRRLYSTENEVGCSLMTPVFEGNIMPTLPEEFNQKVMIPFTTRFMKNPVRDNERQWDPNMRAKLEGLKQAFMCLLLKSYGCDN